MLKTINLTKKFGNFTAVSNLNFEVKKGEVLGLLGKNGAGKTTTLRTLATMLKPSAGTAQVCGYDLLKEPEKVREHIGVLFGGENGLYDRLTVAENISYFGELYNMNQKSIRERLHLLTEIFEMQDYLHRRTAHLSKGMKQKVAFARSIIHNPQLIILDEPTSGLDISAIRDVHQFISACKKTGQTIILSSHLMFEVEKLCDRIGLIHRGCLIELGTIAEIKQKFHSDDLEAIFLKVVGENS